MKRDMDLVRLILLSFDATEVERVSPKSLVFDGYTADQILFHVELMKEAGLLDHSIIRPETAGVGRFGASWDMGLRPTMEGYDFADSVRNPEIWKKTRSGALKAGGWTVDLLKDLAKGFLRKKIEELTGIQL